MQVVKQTQKSNDVACIGIHPWVVRSGGVGMSSHPFHVGILGTYVGCDLAGVLNVVLVSVSTLSTPAKLCEYIFSLSEPGSR